jgi:hypothetical protein
MLRLFSSIPLPGRIKLLEREVRADMDWWLAIDGKLSLKPLGPTDGICGMPME